MNNLALGAKIALFSAIVVALALIIVIAQSSSRAFDAARSGGIAQMRSEIRSAANDMSKVVETALTASEGFADTAAAVARNGRTSGDSDGREVLSQTLRESLVDHENWFGTWTLARANVLGGADADWIGRSGGDVAGIYTPYWVRDGADIVMDTDEDYDATEDFGEDFYVVSEASKLPAVLEPYVEILTDDSEIVMTSATAPVIIDGKVIAVSGVDLELGALQSRVAEEKPFGVGRVWLVTDSTVQHSPLAYLMTPGDRVLTLHAISAGPAAATGLIGRLVQCQQDFVAFVAWTPVEGIPLFLFYLPGAIQMPGNLQRFIDNLYVCVLKLRFHSMSDKLRAYQCVNVPVPLVGKIAPGGVHTEPAAAIFHPWFKCCALVSGKNIARHIVPDYKLELLEQFRCMHRAIFTQVGFPALCRDQVGKDSFRYRNRILVDKTVGLGKDQHRWPGKFRQYWCDGFVIGAGNNANGFQLIICDARKHNQNHQQGQ